MRSGWAGGDSLAHAIVVVTMTDKPAPMTPPPPSRGSHKEYDFYHAIQDYLDRAARIAKVEPYVQTILSQPKNELIVNFPVKMDGGDVRLFKGYRVQHNNILGPF